MKFSLFQIILASASVASAVAIPSTVAETNINKRGGGVACLAACAPLAETLPLYAACLAACTASGVPDGTAIVDEYQAMATAASS